MNGIPFVGFVVARADVEVATVVDIGKVVVDIVAVVAAAVV